VKIVQAVGWYYPESWGGTEIYVSGLARRLRAAGHDMAVAAPDDSHLQERCYEHDGIPVYRYPIPAQPTRDEAQGSTTVRGAECFHRWLAALAPDIVHFHTFVTGLGLAEVDAARAAGARVIVTTHSASLGFICARGTMMRWGTEPCDGITAERKCAGCLLQQRGVPRRVAALIAAVPRGVADLARRLPGRAGALFALPAFIRDQQARQQRLLASADRFVLLTDWARQTVIDNGAPPARIAVNRLGIAHRPRKQKPGPDVRPTAAPVRLAYVGRFDPIKGVEDFVRALRSLPADLLFHAELIGPIFTAADRRFVERLREMIGADSRITIAQPIPHGRILQALAEIDVVCCPSIAAEGGPTVAIEAHAVGTPVIGTRIGGLPELVADGINGLLVPPGDWRALADAVRAIVTDPAGTVDCWRRALPVARTLDEVTRDYLAMYADVPGVSEEKPDAASLKCAGSSARA
jgi:glycosyltransferase involved in cell wall biosynthesis